MWTLDECIDSAKANNIQIKKAELNQQLSETSVLQSKMNFLPLRKMLKQIHFRLTEVLDFSMDFSD
jgi:hypothetical protein